MDFGSINSTPGWWHIQCEPQVRARLKRVFPRVPERSTAVISLSATPENSRELQWFLQRYPMTISADDAARLCQQSEAHVDLEMRIADVLARRAPPPDAPMAKPARDYQLFAGQLCETAGGLLLADDLGLGKTVSAIVPLTRSDNLPAVVVCPTHMPSHWAEKLAEFVPHLKVHVIRTGKVYPLLRAPKSRTADLWPERLPDVIIINYHKLRTWAATLAELARYIIADECQALRSGGSLICSAFDHLRGRARLCMGLSATPIYNYGGEFFSVVNALRPDALGTYEEFTREWCSLGSDGKARLRDAEHFGAYLRREGIMLRRTRADVGRELPAVTKIVHEVDSDAEVFEKMQGDALDLARTIVARNQSFRGELMQASGKFEGLVRQATGVAKAPFVAQFVRMLVEGGAPVILFGWHLEVYGIWREALADLNPQFYTGEQSPAEKERARRAFLDGESSLFIMSLRAGAGVDGLQKRSPTVVFGELDWSPGAHEQCIGRADRDGQTDPVFAYFLTAGNGSDPAMIDVLGVKREQIEGVRNPGGPTAERIDTGSNPIRDLAAAFLAARGQTVEIDDDADVINLHDTELV